jgi:hypothetical protein
LHVERHLADLVEEQRAGARLDEQSVAIANRRAGAVSPHSCGSTGALAQATAATAAKLRESAQARSVHERPA